MAAGEPNDVGDPALVRDEAACQLLGVCLVHRSQLNGGERPRWQPLPLRVRAVARGEQHRDVRRQLRHHVLAEPAVQEPERLVLVEAQHGGNRAFGPEVGRSRTRVRSPRRPRGNLWRSARSRGSRGRTPPHGPREPPRPIAPGSTCRCPRHAMKEHHGEPGTQEEKGQAVELGRPPHHQFVNRQHFAVVRLGRRLLDLWSMERTPGSAFSSFRHRLITRPDPRSVLLDAWTPAPNTSTRPGGPPATSRRPLAEVAARGHGRRRRGRRRARGRRRFH